jgi:tetratricopeptide (TPR) repeat protein
MIYKIPMIRSVNYLVFSCIVLLTVFVSCKPQPETVVENMQHTDSLLNTLNSPELKELNKKILENPNDAGLYNERAKLYFKFRLLEDAIYDAKRALRIDTTNAEYYLTQADIFFAANETRNAKDVLERVVKKFPQNTDGLLKLAELFFLVKQYENAFSKINDALKINENLAKAYYLKGNIYKEIGDTAKAISSLETALDQDNQHYGAFFDLGIIYAARKNTVAMEYYDNALRVKPNSVEALYAKAKLLQDVNKMDESIAVYKSVLKVDSLHTFSLYNIGAIEFEIKKDVAKALFYFTQAINSNPKYAEAYFARGACYQELKDKDNAIADYSMCLQLKPNFEPAVEALNAIKK